MTTQKDNNALTVQDTNGAVAKPKSKRHRRVKPKTADTQVDMGNQQQSTDQNGDILQTKYVQGYDLATAHTNAMAAGYVEGTQQGMQGFLALVGEVSQQTAQYVDGLVFQQQPTVEALDGDRTEGQDSAV